MKKSVALLLALLMVSSLFTVASAETLDPFTAFVGEGVDLYHVTSTSFASVDADPRGVDGQYLAQHFVPAEDTVAGVTLCLKYLGGQGTMHLEIRKGDANGESVFAKDVEIVAKGNVAAWYTFDFGETVSVTPGEKYAVTFWLSSKSTGDVCLTVGSYVCNDGLDLWRHKRFEYAGGSDPYGTLYEEKDLPLKSTGYTVGFEILTPNKLAAMEVDAMISALPKTITVNDEEAIVACVTAYGLLNDDAKALVMNLDALNAAMDAFNTAKEQYAKDVEAAAVVEEKINNLPTPTDVADVHADVVEAVQNEYNALTDAQKALVSEDAKTKLNEVVAALKAVTDAAAVEEVEEMISALPTPTDITIDDIGDILAASLLFDELTADQKAMVDETLAEKLTQILAVVEEWGKYDMGDVTGDGKVDAKDALLALKAAVQKAELSYIQFLVADIDASDKVDAKDALEMLKFTVGKPSLLDEFYAPIVE